jgi:acetolactate synthase-1/2/3 large subunit
MAGWTVKTALRTALGGRRGPVFIQLPIDIMAKTVSQTKIHQNPKIGLRIRDIEGGGIDEAVQLLINAKRPVLFAGGGCHYASRAEQEILALTDWLQSPIVTTWLGTGVISGDHPLWFGQLGMNARPFTRAPVEEADVLLAVGCRFSSNSTGSWSQINPDAKFIHIDIDPREIGKNYPVAVGIIGDAKTVLAEMVARTKNFLPEKVNRDEWINRLSNFRKDWFAAESKKIHSDAFPLKPQRVCTEIDSFFDEKTIFTLDAGANDHWVAHYVRPREPRAWLRNGAGAMGYGLPAGLAAKLLYPDRTVVAIMGDGGFMQSFEELASAMQLELPILVCVLNDGSLNYPRIVMKHIFQRDFSKYTDYIHPDFGKLAEAFGCFGIQVSKASNIKPALKDALEATKKGKPAVIDFLIDKNEELGGYRSLVAKK